MCKVCTCKFDIDYNILSSSLKDNRVKLYQPAKLDIFKTLIMVEDVQTDKDCMWLCLGLSSDSDRRRNYWEQLKSSDSWIFNANRTCSCMSMRSCFQPCRLSALQNIQTESNRSSNDGHVFLQVSNTVSCDSGQYEVQDYILQFIYARSLCCDT